MKKLLFVFLVGAFAACGGETEETTVDSSATEVTVDTTTPVVADTTTTVTVDTTATTVDTTKH